jgi:hypothetical protein
MMNRISETFRHRRDECAEFRRALILEVGRCEVCGHNPRAVRPGNIAWRLAVHEIANGPNRQKALDRRYAVLVVCPICHDALGGKGDWPECRQLAVLKRRRPHDYDLAAYLSTFHPNAPHAITEAEVESWTQALSAS